jgi:hypothetical protein
MVPSDRVACAFRLCRDCASKTGAKVTEIGQLCIAHVQP